MPWKQEWKTIFTPEFESGGLSLTRDQVALRLFENAESPATTGTLSAAWTGTNVTVTRETSAPLNGEGSVKVVVAGGAGSVYKTLDRAKFGYVFPGHNSIRIRYVKFRATCDTGTETVRATFGDASDANHYRYWNISVGQSKYVEHIVDLDPDNTESYPAPTTGSTTFDPEAIDRFGFTNLTSGRTFYFDDIEFLYEYSLPDIMGFPTEAPVGMGDVGTVNARLNGLWADVKALEGQTQQYAKQGIAIAEIAQACSWALELNSDFAPPTTTEIEPGNYTIDQVRGGSTTNIVASTPASESTGTIYASYTPTETTWSIGDLVKVTFSGGYIRTDETPTETLTANATAGNAYVDVDNAYEFQVGWLVRVYDDVNGSEWMTVSELTSPTRVTFSGNLAANHTTANNAGLTRSIRTDLTTAVFFTMLQEEAGSYKVLATGTFTTSSATVPADTSRTEVDNYWNGTWLMPVAGSEHNQPRLIVDFANTGGVFTIDAENPFTGATGTVEYVILGNNDQLVPATDGTNNQTPAHVIGSKADTADFTWDVTTSSAIRLIKGLLGVEVIEEGTLTTDSATVPADTTIGATYANDYFNGSWLMTVSGNAKFQPRLIVDFATTTGIFTLDPEHPFTAAPGTVAYVILSRNASLVPAADGTNSYTPAHVVGNKASTAIYASTDTADVIRYLKGILGSMVIGTGTFTTSSATVPADTTMGAAKGNDYFNGALLVPLTGDDAFQPRLIADFATTTGVYTIDANHPFTSATGLVTYIILASQGDLVTATDSTNNQTVMDVVGSKADAATLDDMTALATASLVAEVKRILLRMSTDAFTADIQGSARTELDVMIGILATYIAASGAAYSVQMNNQTARTNIEQTFEDLATVLGVSGTSVITNINNSANVTYDAVAQKFAAILGADAANVFNPTIQGSARTTLDSALEVLASYFTASSAAYSAKVNNQDLRTSLEAILQDFFAVVGCDGTNTFSVIAQGAAQTVLDTALYSLAQYFATNGAAISATVNPGGSARATLELILEDIGDMLAGSTGIVTWPGSVKYGNGVSMAEAVAYVSDTADAISSAVSEGTLEITEDNGSSTTVITASEITQGAGFWKGALVLCTSGDNDGQTRPVVASAVGSVTVFPAFGATIDIADTFLLISTWRPDVWNQQTDVPITFNATNVAATVLDLSTAGYSYMVNSLRIKVANPGAQTVTFSLCEVVNDVAETVVDTFVIDSSNYTLYHSLTDMFGLSKWAGDDLKITAVASDAGPYAVTGQYQYALARTL